MVLAVCVVAGVLVVVLATVMVQGGLVQGLLVELNCVGVVFWVE